LSTPFYPQLGAKYTSFYSFGLLERHYASLTDMIGAVVGSDVRWSSVVSEVVTFGNQDSNGLVPPYQNQRMKIGHTKRSREQQPLFGPNGPEC
jgi:hypothetical protein